MHARKGLSNSDTVSKAVPLAPFTIRTKVLLQEMWNSGLDWDDKLSQTLIQKETDSVKLHVYTPHRMHTRQ